MGEYAAHTKNRKNNWESALAEAAFMTGLERNADVVVMSSYAPLFAHVDAWQWNVDLIWFDNLRVCPTPNYHVQKLFSTNRGHIVLPTEVAGTNLFAVASADKKTGEIILKVVNAAGAPVETDLNIPGIAWPARAIVLASDKLSDENTLDAPTKITPQEQPVPDAHQTLPAYSVTVLRLKTNQ
jgi:alpha-N-arabinofuranosidase